MICNRNSRFLQELISSFCFAHLHHSDEKSACTSGKKFLEITGIGMGAAKRSETREDIWSPAHACLLHIMFKLFEAQI